VWIIGVRYGYGYGSERARARASWVCVGAGVYACGCTKVRVRVHGMCEGTQVVCARECAPNDGETDGNGKAARLKRALKDEKYDGRLCDRPRARRGWRWIGQIGHGGPFHAKTTGSAGATARAERQEGVHEYGCAGTDTGDSSVVDRLCCAASQKVNPCPTTSS
jgi:hypothetical protein